MAFFGGAVPLGRIVASELEVPILLVKTVQRG
jgi:hypothetical protein